MKLIKTYKKIKQSIVGFVPKYRLAKSMNDPEPPIAPIFGTGFVIADSLIVTNNHVLEAIERCPRPKNAPEEEWPASGLLLYDIGCGFRRSTENCRKIAQNTSKERCYIGQIQKEEETSEN